MQGTTLMGPAERCLSKTVFASLRNRKAALTGREISSRSSRMLVWGRLEDELGFFVSWRAMKEVGDVVDRPNNDRGEGGETCKDTATNKRVRKLESLRKGRCGCQDLSLEPPIGEVAEATPQRSCHRLGKRCALFCSGVCQCASFSK